MKVITFSRTFPPYHPRAKQLTFFAEKFWQSMIDNDKTAAEFKQFKDAYRKALGFTTDGQGWQEPHIAKHHTIRKGHRWKKGDWFSPRVWGEDINPKSGRSGAYHSKQIAIGPDTQITEVWDFRITKKGEMFIGEQEIHLPELRIIAGNDGFENSDDLKHWFATVKEFDGQIVCWNSKVNYKWIMPSGGLDKPVRKKPRCYNCKFAGPQFKIGKLSHLHCVSPKMEKYFKEDPQPSAWESLMVFSGKCDDHQYKDEKCNS